MERESRANEEAVRPRKQSKARGVAVPLESCRGGMLVGGLLSTTPMDQPRVETSGNL